VEEGTVYIENNGIRRLPEEYMTVFSATICAFLAIFRRKLSIFAPYRLLKWIRRAALATTSLFICSGGRTQDGVMLDFYRVR
jgi:hypothetical protein